MRFAIILFSILMVSSALAYAQDLETTWNNLIVQNKFQANKQSYCTSDGNHTLGKNIDMRVRPASVSKLYVSLWALEKLGPDYRYKTQIIINNNRLHIVGAHDSFFSSENIFYIISQLNNLGITTLEEVTFSNSFFFNWQDQPQAVADELKKYLNTDNWSDYIRNEFEQTLTKVTQLAPGIKLNPTITMNVDSVRKSTYTPFNVKNTSRLIIFESSLLRFHLKEMNIYSNNFIAQKIFDLLGGSEQFSQFLLTKFKATSKTAYFYSGSGLDENYTTCALTIKVVDRLLKIINKLKLSPSEIISVPGADAGTLAKRFTGPNYKKSLWAKTGTLRHTSTLAGILNTSSGIKYFGIFNHTYQTNKARNMQDEFVKDIFSYWGGSEIFDYQAKNYIPLIDAKWEGLDQDLPVYKITKV